MKILLLSILQSLFALLGQKTMTTDFTITVQEKQKQEGKKRPVLVEVDKTYAMDGVKYAKYLLTFK